MDGYTVKEAASILGIPKQRVWELIARGVLAGKSEVSGAMRVFLQPQPPKVAEPAPPVVRPSNGNGNGGGISVHDLGPFRELLTEFRNLTERYGQALLALGEARGEVAALRMRVELLETRMEIRLPSPSIAPVAPSPWESPTSEPATAHEPAADAMRDGGGLAPEAGSAIAGSAMAEGALSEAPAESSAEAPTATDGAVASPEAPGALPRIEPAFEPLPVPPFEPVEPVATLDVEERAEEAPPEFGRRPRRRRGGSRSAVEGIAQALARADDPTGGSLPGGPETAEALRALRDEMAAAPSRGGSPFLADGEDVMDEPALATAIEVDELLADDQLGGAALQEELELATPREDEPSVAYSPPGSVEEEWVGLETASLEELEIEPEVVEPAVELADTLESVAEPAAGAESVAEPAPQPESAVAEQGAQPEPFAQSVESAAEPVDALASGLSEAAAVLTRESSEPSVVLPPGYSTSWEEPDWIAEEDLLEQPAALEPTVQDDSAELATPSAPEDVAQLDAETATVEEEGTPDEDARVPAVLPTEELEPAIADWSAWPMASDVTDVQAEPAEVAEPAAVAEPMAIEPEVGAAAESDSESVPEDAVLEPEPEAAMESTFEPESAMESTPEPEPPADAESTPEHEPTPQTASATEPEAVVETQPAPILETTMDAGRPEPSDGALLEDELHGAEGEARETGANIDQEVTTAPEVAIERAWEPEPAYGFDQPRAPMSPPATTPEPSSPPQEARAKPADFEEELMWLGDEFRSQANSPSSASGPSATGSVAPSSPRPAAGSLPGFEDTLGRMAAERGWEVSEISAIRALLSGPRHASIGDEPATEQAEPATAASSELEAGIPMEQDAEIASVDRSNADEGEALEATAPFTIDEAEAEAEAEAEKEPANLDTEAAGANEMEVAIGSAELEPDDGSSAPDVAEPTHAERASSVWVGPGPLQGLRDAMAAVDEGDELLGWEQSTRYQPSATEPLGGSEPAEGTVGAPEPPLGEEAPQVDSPPPHPAVARPDASNQSATELPLPPLSTAEPSGAATSSTQQADWLRGRRGPAADAYRRLRRLFPR
jgi:hypothetical protein